MMTTTHADTPFDHAEPAAVPAQVDETPDIVEPPKMKLQLTRLLRWGGGVVLVVAAVAFMFQGFSSFNPMTRHWLMLAICALLGLMGLVTGALIKEEKGARLFFGFAAASFPVLASQLGAMLFSVFAHPPLHMPQPLVFTLVHISKAAAVSVITLIVAIPFTYLAFRILARSQATLLTSIYCLANLCVLVPFREDVIIGAIITVIAALIFWADTTRLRRDFRLNNFEGLTARLLLTCPLAVILARSIFYPMSPVFHGSMLILLSAYLAFFRGQASKKTGIRLWWRILGQIGMAAGWLICVRPNLGMFNGHEGIAVYVGLLPITIAICGQSLATAPPTAGHYRNAASSTALTSVVIAHLLGATPIVSVIGVVVALAIVSMGTLTGEKMVFACGVLAGTLSLGNFGYRAFQLHSNYAWAILALIGIAVMFSASLLEKNPSWQWLKNNTPLGEDSNNDNNAVREASGAWEALSPPPIEGLRQRPNKPQEERAKGARESEHLIAL